MRQLLKYDILLQWRQKFWAIYLFITIIYTVMLLNMPKADRYFVSSLLIMFDTAILGITFIGAILLFEKQQNTMQSLFITPLTIKIYIWSKVFSLAIISLLTSSCIIFIPNGNINNIHLVIVATILSSFIFTLTGIGFAAKANTLNQYIWSISIGTLWAIVPAIPYFMGSNYSLRIFPVNAALDLLLSAERPQSTHIYIIDILSLIAWCFVAYKFASTRMKKNLLN